MVLFDRVCSMLYHPIDYSPLFFQVAGKVVKMELSHVQMGKNTVRVSCCQRVTSLASTLIARYYCLVMCFAGKGEGISAACEMEISSSPVNAGRRCVSCMCLWLPLLNYLKSAKRVQHNVYYLIIG